MDKRRAALELLKKSRERGESLVKSYKASNANDIYEEMDEADYHNIVKHRQKEESFIVDDDGCGYVDDGLEVWDRSDDNYHSDEGDSKADSADAVGRASKKKKRSMLEGTATGNKDISALFHKAAASSKKVNDTSAASGKEFLNSLFESDSMEGINFKNRKSRPSQRMSHVTDSETTKVQNRVDIDSIFEKEKKHSFQAAQPEGTPFRPQSNDLGFETLPSVSTNTQSNPHNEILHENLNEELCGDDYFSAEDLKEIENSEILAMDANAEPNKIPEPQMNESIPLPLDALKAVSLAKTNIGPTDNATTFASISSGNLQFYWIDLQEKPNSASLFLVGKLYNSESKKFVNSCVTVGSIEKSIFFLPKEDANPEQLMTEIEQIMHQNKIRSFKQKIVSRKYAFEIANIPIEADYVKVSFTHCNLSNLPTAGKYYSHVFGTNTSLTESFLIKRKIMGPCWLSLHSASIFEQAGISWYPFEVQVDCKNVSQSLQGHPDDPTIDVVALDFKTVINQKTKSHEIIAANLLLFKDVNPNQTNQNYSCSNSIKIIRHIDGIQFPVRFQEHFYNKGFGRIDVLKNERILLNKICTMLNLLDPDIIVGHNILNFDLEILFNRIKECKCEEWSRLGRIKFSQLPKGANSTEFAIKQLFNGRLICDTYLASKELVKSKLYSLESLALSELNVVRPVLDDERIIEYFQSVDSLCYLINHNENDSFLSAKLAFKIGVIPLSKQLTILAGNLWWRTLTGARSERNEYLLLHEFHNAKYVVPDKRMIGKNQSYLSSTVEADYENENAPATTGTTSKRKAAYAGGLVLEPKKGLYDKIILLLDFNSLYPSIIQEYNICFTTVERSMHDFSDEHLPNLPDKNIATGILPKLLATLVARRRQVKNLMKESGLSDSQLHELEIRQKALKLTANSMYGCLGFAHSRFYAKELAMLITAKGREILQNTVEIAQQQCHLDVIYGDTDSVMINTGCTALSEAKRMGYDLKKAVNERYRLVEIEIDGVFNRLLLLKKKKYAALIYDERTQQNALEMKGLDLVRRDWCNLSVDCCTWVLDQIMCPEMGKEEAVEKIHEYLEQVGNSVRSGHVELDKFIINKNLTKHPEEYADKHAQPHVQVALRMIERGKVVKPGDIVPYVICKGVEAGSLLAQNAHHPEELKKDPALQIDYEWYLCQQVHPPIARLCQYIQGTDNARLASCLGLDYGKYQSRLFDDEGNESRRSESSIPSYSSCFAGDTEFQPRFKLEFCCSYCSTMNEISSAWSKQCTNCSKAPMLATVYMGIVNFTKQLQRCYYSNQVKCDDRLCGYASDSTNLANSGMSCPSCQGTLHVVFGEKDCYFHLKYVYELFRSFNDESCALLLQKVDKLIDEISFRTVQLDTLFSFLSLASKPAMKG